MINANYRTGLLAIMICVIVMMLAPARAQAHAGHDHANSAVMIESEVAIASDLDLLNSSIEAGSKLDGTEQPKHTGCTGGCCSHAHSCCGIQSTAAPTVDSLRWSRAKKQLLLARVLIGVSPNAHRKPPRFVTSI